MYPLALQDAETVAEGLLPLITNKEEMNTSDIFSKNYLIRICTLLTIQCKNNNSLVYFKYLIQFINDSKDSISFEAINQLSLLPWEQVSQANLIIEDEETNVIDIIQNRLITLFDNYTTATIPLLHFACRTIGKLLRKFIQYRTSQSETVISQGVFLGLLDGLGTIIRNHPSNFVKFTSIKSLIWYTDLNRVEPIIVEQLKLNTLIYLNHLSLFFDELHNRYIEDPKIEVALFVLRIIEYQIKLSPVHLNKTQIVNIWTTILNKYPNDVLKSLFTVLNTPYNPDISPYLFTIFIPIYYCISNFASVLFQSSKHQSFIDNNLSHILQKLEDNVIVGTFELQLTSFESILKLEQELQNSALTNHVKQFIQCIQFQKPFVHLALQTNNNKFEL